MDVRYEYHVKDCLTFAADEREAYYAAQRDWLDAVEEAGGDTTGLTPPSESDYYIRDEWNPSIVKLTFDRPSRIQISGINEKDSVAFENTFVEGNWTSGQWANAEAFMTTGYGGIVIMNCIKGISPVLYLRLGDGGVISVYAEK